MDELEQFWRGVVTLDGKSGFAHALLDDARAAHGDDELRLAVDVISRPQAGCCAVLLSLVQGCDQSERCLALAAFSNRTSWADVMRARGFLALDTLIELTEHDGRQELRVLSPLSARTEEPLEQATASVGAAALVLVCISGITFEAVACGNASAYGSESACDPDLHVPEYILYRYSPEAGEVLDMFVISHDQVALPRTGMAIPQGQNVQVSFHKIPDLPFALPEEQTLTCEQSWYGRLSKGFEWSLANAFEPSSKQPSRRTGLNPVRLPTVPRLQALRTAGFRFDDVEFIGLRIDLRPYGKAADDLLQSMIEPLNFHRRDGIGNTTFEFRPAARAITLELLRYGRMYWGDHPPLEGPDRFESQYELLLRVLVGRVDDSSASARDPAVFVPAILVDNPWSKVLGRELQGFEKRLANFLDIDGRRVRFAGTPGPDRSPLFDIVRVDLVDDLSAQAIEGMPVVELDVPPVDPDWPRQPQRLGPYSARTVRPLRWRQQEFTELEFRRAFARSVLENGLSKFHSIQAAPIDRRGLPGAWITGSFTLRDLQVAFPSGIARVAIRGGGAKSPLPRAFEDLWKLVGGQPIALPSGDWYIARGGMDLSLSPGLP
jgi:hypothetical protein